MYKRQNLGNKFPELINLKFSGKYLLVKACLIKTNSCRTNADNSKVPGRFPLPGSLTML